MLLVGSHDTARHDVLEQLVSGLIEHGRALNARRASSSGLRFSHVPGGGGKDSKNLTGSPIVSQLIRTTRSNRAADRARADEVEQQVGEHLRYVLRDEPACRRDANEPTASDGVTQVFADLRSYPRVLLPADHERGMWKSAEVDLVDVLPVHEARRLEQLIEAMPPHVRRQKPGDEWLGHVRRVAD